MSVSPVISRPAPIEVDHDLREFVAEQLDLWRQQDGLLMLAIPAPLVQPETLLRLDGAELGVLWDPPTGESFAGTGAAWRIDLDGEDRFHQLQTEAARLWPRLTVRAHPDCAQPRPRLYGGLAFAVGAAAIQPWEEFGDGCFTLPRMGYGRRGERAWLCLTVDGAELRAQRAPEVWTSRLMAVLQALPRHAGFTGRDVASVKGLANHPVPLERLSVDRWVEQIEAIRAGIHDGRFEKIVAARRTALELVDPPVASAVLQRLARGLRASTRFAFCREQSTFLGATPERLIARHGRRIATEALAGSIEVGDEQAAQLLSSRKDLREHQLVVEAIVRRLEPLCERFTVADEPQIRELRDVLHLLTPIVGELRQERHVLELVEKLHPTPAVGGVPTVDAVRWIVEHEADPRGWYAAPIGWFDADGDGEFAVALRSCVLRGQRAYLYAGAGIVGDSDPLLEYTETELKEQALLGSLEAP